MPKISHILKEEATVEVDLGDGETLNIVFRPGVVTPEAHDATMDLVDQQRQPAAVAKSLAATLVKWDLLTDDGDPYPIDEKSLRSLPFGFLGKVFFALQDSLSPNEEKSSKSGGSF